jgi:hypothetical protein
MKKLGIAAMLATVVTVGGVYAAWNYAGGKADTATASKTLQITQADLQATSGTLSVQLPTVLAIDNMGNYTPGWCVTGDLACKGDMVVKFVPNTGAATTSFTCTIKLINNTYLDDDGKTKQIIVVDGDTITQTFDYTSGEGEQTYTLSIAEFLELLPINDEITVPTYEEYGKFSKAVSTLGIEVSVVQNTSLASNN